MPKTKKKGKAPNVPEWKVQKMIEKAKTEAVGDAVEYAWAIMFTALRDKFGWTNDQLSDLWASINSLSESVNLGYINVTDLAHTLKEEAGIRLVETKDGAA